MKILSQYYFLAFSALPFAALIFAHLAVIVAESLALASSLILTFFFSPPMSWPTHRIEGQGEGQLHVSKLRHDFFHQHALRICPAFVIF